MRDTLQRRLLHEVLEEAPGPLLPAELHLIAQTRLPKLGIATVYRELARLTETGEAQTVLIGDETPRYELKRGHHHHFKCEQCARVYDLEYCIGKGVAEMLPQGFSHTHHDITLYGRCASCA